MMSKVAHGCLVLAALVDATNAAWVCANNAAINTSKSIMIPDMGLTSCGAQEVQGYVSSMDAAYNAAVSNGTTGIAICATKFNAFNQNLSVGGVMDVGKNCCDSPNQLCNINQICSNPNDFVHNINISFGDGENTSCYDMGSGFVGDYGGNCDAPTEDNQTAGNHVRMAGYAGCCGASKLTACGTAKSMCVNPQSFQKDLVVFTEDNGDNVTCGQLGMLFAGANGNCNAPGPDRDSPNIRGLVNIATLKGCCGSTVMNACGSIPSVCANHNNFIPNALPFGSADNTTCGEIGQTFVQFNGNCSARVGGDSGGPKNLGTVVKGAGVACCGLGKATACGMPSQICLNPQDFMPDGTAMNNSDGNATTCAMLQLSFQQYGGNCSAKVDDNSTTTIGQLVVSAATNGCCGLNRYSKCGVGLTTCADPNNFLPNHIGLQMGNESITCADVAAYFARNGSNCSAMTDLGKNFSDVFKDVIASGCCGSPSAQSVCDVPLPTLPTLPTTTPQQSTSVSQSSNTSNSSTTSSPTPPPTSGSSYVTATTTGLMVLLVAVAAVL